MRNKGFTLIELMVAITIVAILATIGMVLYSQIQKTARDSKRVGELNEIKKAAITYQTSRGSFPERLSDIATYFERGAAPTDPKGTAYSYTVCSTDSTRFAVCAELEDCGTRCHSLSASDGCSLGAAQEGQKYYRVGN